MKQRFFKGLTAAAVSAALLCSLCTAFAAEEDSYVTAPESGEYVSEYVRGIVDYLSVYAREGVGERSLYKAGLLAALKQSPELYETVMEAMLSSIDEYSEFYSSGDFEQFIFQLAGSVGGIGITYINIDGRITVDQVNAASPAERAGILSGDIICSVNGTELAGMTNDEALNLLRGEVGSSVTIGVLRGGLEEPLYFTMIREEIGEKQSVVCAELSGVDDQNPDQKREVMYIKIHSFMDNSAELFGQAMDKADSLGITDIIIDLRNNGGGYLGEAAKIANYFVPEGNVIVTEDHKLDLFDIVYKSDNKRTVKNDVVLLVNENSASASEVLSAALMENGVGVVIGTKTYGKGTVQSTSQLRDGEAMKYTSAYYLTPNGNNIDKIGITPDAVVENTSVPFDYSGYENFDYSAVYEMGANDINVSRAKRILGLWGWYGGDMSDPHFDSELALSVTRFQEKEGLFPYGVLDLTTQAALYDALTQTTSEVDDQLYAAMSHFGIIYDE